MHGLVVALLLLHRPGDMVQSRVTLTHAAIVKGEIGGYEDIVFDLTNNSAQAVTGWAIRYEMTLADGTKRTEGLSAPGPLIADVDEARGIRAVPAFDIVREKCRLGPRGSPRIVDLSVTLLWVIFADRSFEGDRAGVKLAFDDREREYRFEVFRVTALRSGQAEAKGIDALRAALRHISAAPQEMQAAMSVDRGNLQRAIEGTVTVNPDEYLAMLIRRAEQRRDRYDAQRRPPW
jgi:hypothetical protein